MSSEINIQDQVPLSEVKDRDDKYNKPKRVLPWHSTWLPQGRTGILLGPELTKKRNHAILALYIQFISTVAGFSLFFARRNRLYLVANILSLTFALIGFFGSLRLKKWHIAAHSVFTGGIIGVFWFYLLLEAIFKSNIGESEGKHISERATLFLFALPYLVDTIAGIFTFRLMYVLFKEDEEKEIKSPEEAEPILADKDYDVTSDLCCVCMVEQKKIALYRCGHQALCKGCAESFKKKHIKKCPLCLSKIDDFIEVYN